MESNLREDIAPERIEIVFAIVVTQALKDTQLVPFRRLGVLGHTVLVFCTVSQELR